MSTHKPKRVLFHYSVFNQGGAEMSILRMTRFLAENGWDVELVLSTGGGNLEFQVDPRVKIIHLRERVAGHRFMVERRMLRKLLWIVVDGLPFLYSRFQWLYRALPFHFRDYDAAVISLHGLSPWFCCRWVRARRRVQWIRNDLLQCDGEGLARDLIRRYHRSIDTFVCVSRTAHRSLVSLFPELVCKSRVLYNVVDSDDMIARAAKGGNPYGAFGDVLKVVTVCRLSDRSKGLFRMLSVHRRLRDDGVDFRWFIVGEGPDRERLERAASENGMGDTFILLGRKDNPFPYYKHADVAATLSNYEGLSGAVTEAKVLGKPVIATRFSGIEEQIVDGENGLIVENDEDAIVGGLKRLLSDKVLRSRLANNHLNEEIADDRYKLRAFDEILS